MGGVREKEVGKQGRAKRWALRAVATIGALETDYTITSVVKYTHSAMTCGLGDEPGLPVRRLQSEKHVCVSTRCWLSVGGEVSVGMGSR